jgi:hypothetical protein
MWQNTIFFLSNAKIVGWNPSRGMDVYVRLLCVCVALCVGRSLASDCPPPGWRNPTQELKNGQGQK